MRIQTLLARAEKEHGFRYNFSFDSAEMLARTEEFIRLNQRWPASSSKDKEEGKIILYMNKEYNGEINAISSSELMKDTDLMNKMMSLVTSVYDADDAELFYQEIAESTDIVIVYMTLDDVVIGMGCICESHISFGVYELFWGMLDAKYRGNGWGKILVESRLEWVAKHNKGLSSPNDVIVVTKSPWHLTRCGFETLKQLNSDGEVLMYRKLKKVSHSRLKTGSMPQGQRSRLILFHKERGLKTRFPAPSKDGSTLA